MSMSLRRLTPDDAEAMRTLRLRGLRDHPDAFGQSYEAGLAEPVEKFAERLAPGGDGLVVGAFVDGELVGIAGLVRRTSAKMRHMATLWGMYVRPESRGQGIGKALVARIVEEARALGGVLRVDLRVVTTNEAACALYRAAGFEIWGLEPMSLCVDNVMHEEYVMGLLL